ncbi:Guanylate kinase [compost metagenome]
MAAKCPGDAVRVFILPPSLEELRRRLVTRSQDAEDVIERRVANAKGEIEHCDEFDYVLVNEDFDRSYAELAHIYHAERSCRRRNLWVDGYKAALLKEVV